MRRMLILLAILSIGVATQLDARGMHGKRGHRGGDHKARIAAELELTEDQLTQIEALKVEHRAEREAARDEGRAAFEAILNVDQLEILSTHRESRESRESSDRRKRGRPDLGLTDEQKTQLQELRGKRKEAAQASRAGFRDSFKAILTPEQIATLEELKSSRPSRRRGSDKDRDDAGADAASVVQFNLADDGVPTVIDATSWGLIKEQMER